MSTHRSSWNRRERDAARLFRSQRQVLSGSSGRAEWSCSDSTHPRLSVETKLRAGSSVHNLYEPIVKKSLHGQVRARSRW